MTIGLILCFFHQLCLNFEVCLARIIKSSNHVWPSHNLLADATRFVSCDSERESQKPLKHQRSTSISHSGGSGAFPCMQPSFFPPNMLTLWVNSLFRSHLSRTRWSSNGTWYSLGAAVFTSPMLMLSLFPDSLLFGLMLMSYKLTWTLFHLFTFLLAVRRDSGSKFLAYFFRHVKFYILALLYLLMPRVSFVFFGFSPWWWITRDIIKKKK